MARSKLQLMLEIAGVGALMLVTQQTVRLQIRQLRLEASDPAAQALTHLLNQGWSILGR